MRRLLLAVLALAAFCAPTFAEDVKEPPACGTKDVPASLLFERLSSDERQQYLALMQKMFQAPINVTPIAVALPAFGEVAKRLQSTDGDGNDRDAACVERDGARLSDRERQRHGHHPDHDLGSAEGLRERDH